MAVHFQGFVCDEDSQHLADSIRHYSVVTLPAIGITLGKGSPDTAVLQHAREAGRILITSNASDFANEMELAAQRCTPSKCFEGGGMITVPNGMQAFPFAKINRMLRFNGTRIGWEEVFFLNLHVQVQRSGEFSVRRLPVCPYLLKDHTDCETCAELGVL